MPTGAGKSLCFQLPALFSTHQLTIIVSPLLSLIHDQARRLIDLGAKVAQLSAQAAPASSRRTSHGSGPRSSRHRGSASSGSAGDRSSSSGEDAATIPGLVTGETAISQLEAAALGCNAADPLPFNVAFVTPEKLANSARVAQALSGLYRQSRIARLVVDEAHCVSTWGHDYRPDYIRLGGVRDILPRVPLVALTATASPLVRADICRVLGISREGWTRATVSSSSSDAATQSRLAGVCFRRSANRRNLTFSVVRMPPKTGEGEAIARLIKRKFSRQCGIVYCLSKRDTEQISAHLSTQGISSRHYHAGLGPEERQRAQNAWQTGKVSVICATISFGMGIDRANVRFVIHAALPKSIEGLYQESGRAGRDGLPAECIVLYRAGVKMRLERLAQLPSDSPQRKSLYGALLYAETGLCRRAALLAFFGEDLDSIAKFEGLGSTASACSGCDNCAARGLIPTRAITTEADLVAIEAPAATTRCASVYTVDLSLLVRAAIAHLAAVVGPPSTNGCEETAGVTWAQALPSLKAALVDAAATVFRSSLASSSVGVGGPDAGFGVTSAMPKQVQNSAVPSVAEMSLLRAMLFSFDLLTESTTVKSSGAVISHLRLRPLAYRLLDRTLPGDAEGVRAWLRRRRLSAVDAVVTWK
jgi:RecQ family ATP-dependent DNA helicase